jgi:Ca-activated chloride channel family protein
MAHLRVSSLPGLLSLLVLAAGSLAISPVPGRVRGAEEPPASPEESKAAAEARYYTALEEDVTQGALRFKGENGEVVECPLKHTDVKADVSGFVARVNITQTFHNPTKEKIEAVYVFPLPHEAAVDNMTMVIGDRKIMGIIKRREEARRIYEAALAQGQAAALLEQERPNIFTQSVGNIAPGQDVKIDISYVDVLRYDMGTYEFSFPMVVGPRYIPGAPISSPQPQPAELQGKVSPPVADTNRVPDASRISPPVLKPGVRNGHDISLAISLDAGVPVQNLTIPNHQSDVKRDGDSKAQIALSPADSLPNKDFVLRYDVVGEKPAMAMLSHTGKYSLDAGKLGEGYFMLMIQPQEDERLQKSPPREIVFLCDVSGSMSGQPTAKVIESMQHMLKLCREDKDTVQVITFAGQANKLFEKAVPVNKENIARALNFTQGFQGSGGTEMLKGVQLAIDEPVDKERVRIIVMLTDGYIGNEAEIIEHVGKNCGDRVRFWCVGIGSSPNMFLVDGVAKQGGGMGKQLGLEDDAQALSQEVMTRIQRAQLANVKIDWGKLQVAETYPAKIPELWAGRPIIVYGRYKEGAADTITVRGDVEGEAAQWPLAVTLAEKEPQHDVLAKVWARQKIEDLMQQDFYQDSPAIEETVTAIALDYKLMSQYTSFVAVDSDSESTSDAARPPRRMLVPVPLPEGTRWEGFFGEGEAVEALAEAKVMLGDGLARGRRSTMFGRNAAGALGGEPLSRFAVPAQQLAQNFYHAPVRETEALLAKTPALNRLYSIESAARGVRQKYASVDGRFGGGLGGGGFGGYGNASPSPSAPGAAPYGLSLQAEGARQLSRGGRGIVALKELAEFDKKSDAAVLADYDYTGSAIAAGEIAPLAQDAAKALEEAQKLIEKGNLAAAREKLLAAYFLDAAAANFGASGGETAMAALARMEEIRAKEKEAWIKSAPQLAKRLDLVLRDKPLSEALETIAAAAGIDVRIVRGSLADAAELLNRDELRVSFLDLRGATLAEALDWTLQPARLEWSLKEGAVNVATARRQAGQAPWIYDVSLIALPSPEEINAAEDDQKRIEKAQQEAAAFLAAMRGELPQGVRLEWFAPGQLLVIGATSSHERASQVLALLGNDKDQGPLGQAAAELRSKTAQRAKDRKEQADRIREAVRRMEVVLTHDGYAWRLLAAAADGRLDLEALTELQIAWRRPETKKLLEAKSPGVLIRSWWAIAESARALPEEAELGQLAKETQALAQRSADQSVATLKENPSDVQAAIGALYAALASDDSSFRAEAAAAIRSAAGEDASLAQIRDLAAVLLANDSSAIDAAPLAALATSGVQGEDLVALTALACRRAGGDAWDAFRRQQRDLIGKQPLSGDVVVLVNRLAGASLPLVAQAD